MKSRNEVLKNFNSVSNRYAENISVFYSLDVNESLGISYFELNKASNELGQYIARILGKNQYIGVSLSDYFLLPCLIFAIWKSENCFAGVGTQYTKENILGFLKFLKIKYLITDKNEFEFEGKLTFKFSVHKQMFYIWLLQTDDELVISQDFCYAIMTSGTTGEPKIIQVPWSCIIPNAIELSSEFKVTELDCIFQASPYSFDPFFIEFLMTFLNGSSLMIVPDSIKLNPSNLLKTLFLNSKNKFDSSLAIFSVTESENHFHLEVKKVCLKNITVLQMTPSVFQRWNNSEIQNFILSPETQLKVLILGGEKFPKDILKLKHPQNTTRIFNIYGITEISCWAFLNEVTTLTDTEVPIGKPLNSIIYKISENGKFEIGSKERICLVNDEKTIAHPVYRETGDIVKFSDEKIYYSGRSDQVVKKFGIKINLSKIEDYFLKENKLMKQCFCVYDKENLKLGLFYVPDKFNDSQTSFKNVSLEEFYKKEYKIPIENILNIEKPDYLIEISKAPVNSHGKCNKEHLLQYLKDIKKLKRSKPNLEMTFQKLWVEVLNTTKSNTASFLELGGNSILGLHLINKLEEEGVTVPQNFISKLLGGESYYNCLECLSLAQNEFEIPRKHVTFETDESSTDAGDSIQISLLWKADLKKCVDATPTVFYFEGREVLIVGSHSHELYCINSQDGSGIWKTQLGGRIESGFIPTNDGSRGFVGCYDHCAYCVDTKTGGILWKFKTGDMVKSTPCLSSDEKILYVASYDKNLYCLSTSEGELLKLLRLSNGGIFCSGIADDFLQRFFIGTLDGTCLSINQQTNELSWKIMFESPIFASPCLLSDQQEILFTEVVGIVHCLKALTGEKIWEMRIRGNIYSTPIITDIMESQYILFGSHDQHLYCLEYEEKPALKWKQQLDSPLFSKPVILPDHKVVCATTVNGVVCFCDLKDGSLITQHPLNGEIFSSPIHQDNRLFVGCRDNNVYSLKITKITD